MKFAALLMIMSAVTGPQPLNFWALISGQSVTVHSGADANFREMCTLGNGELVHIVGSTSDGRWYKIAPPATGEAFVSAKLLDVANGKGVVKGDRVNVRVRADGNSEIVCQLDRGETVDVRSAEGDWVNIVPPASAEAWIPENVVRRLSDDEAKMIQQQRAQEQAETQARAESENLPARLAARLKELDKMFVDELAKKPAERDYVQIMGEYQRLERESSDEQLNAQARMRVILLASMQNIKTAAAEHMNPEPLPQVNAEAVLNSVGAAPQYANEMKESFNAAQKVAQENPAIKPDVLRKAEGLVVDLGPTLGKTGATHKLTTQDGKIVALLRSSDIDLKPFAGLKVRIAGEFAGEAALPDASGKKAEIIKVVNVEIIIE